MAFMTQELKKRLAVNVKAIMPKGWRYTLRVEHDAAIVCTIMSAPIDLRAGYNNPDNEHIQVNQSTMKRRFSKEAVSVLTLIFNALNDGNHDNSDHQSDYFDVGWYTEINIGKWNSPFIVTIKEGAMRINETTRPTDRLSDVVYRPEGTTKKNTVNGDISKVTAVLSASKSGTATKLAKEYALLKRTEAETKAALSKTNANIKGMVDELFPEADDIYTRIVETKSMIFTVSKMTRDSQKTNTLFDAERYTEELYILLPELTEQLNKLKEKHTKIETVIVRGSAPRLGTPKPVIETTMINESIFDKIKSYAASVTNSIMKSLSLWDSKFDKLKSKLASEMAH